jgi:hypothetical protein
MTLSSSPPDHAFVSGSNAVWFMTIYPCPYTIIVA